MRQILFMIGMLTTLPLMADFRDNNLTTPLEIELGSKFQSCVTYLEPVEECKLQCHAKLVLVGDENVSKKFGCDSPRMPYACFCLLKAQ